MVTSVPSTMYPRSEETDKVTLLKGSFKPFLSSVPVILAVVAPLSKVISSALVFNINSYGYTDAGYTLIPTLALAASEVAAIVIPSKINLANLFDKSLESRIPHPCGVIF